MWDVLLPGECNHPGQEPQTGSDTAPLSGFWSEAQGDLEQDMDLG